MSTTLQIDFVSDVACPWCAVGLGGLDMALDRLLGEIDAHITFQPFELNPGMGPQGQDISEHLTQKYGSTPEQQAEIRERIRERGAAVGFAFKPEGRGRIWNTFDAHRLMRWAAMQHAERALYLALADAAFAHGDNLSDHGTLAGIAARAGLDASAAREMLAGDRFAAEVRTREAHYREHQVFQVPTLVINGRHRVNGALPHDETVAGLRRIAALPT